MINLLPPAKLANIKIARSNTVLRRYIELFLLAIIAMLTVLVVANYYMNAQQKNVQAIIDEDRKTINKLEPIQKEALQLSDTVNTIAGLLTRDIRFSALLEQIGGLTPNGAVLTGLQYSTDDLKAPLVISAQVDNEQTAAVFLNNINSSDVFASAEIKSIIEIEEEDASTSITTPITTDTESTTTPELPKPASPYKFTATINAYFKSDSIGAKR